MKRLPNYSFTKAKEESYQANPDLDLLPRAVSRPNEYELLDGEWNFDFDPDNIGLRENWFIAHQFTSKAVWPGSVESHIAGLRPLVQPWSDQIIVWYEREFDLPEIADEQDTYVQRQLTFGACGYETRVWLNGYPLSTIEGEEVHIGEYTSFSYELDDRILYKKNRITIMIKSTMNADTTRGKQESSVYKRGGIWYQTYTGGVRSIWLETVECNRLRSKVDVLSVIEDDLVRFNLTTRIHHPGHYRIKMEIYNKDAEEVPVAVDEYPLFLEAGQKQQRFVIKIPEAVLWTPERPHLYRLKAQLIDAKGYIAEIQTHFGLRKVEARGASVYLNNERIYLNGMLYQPWQATYEEIKMHMKAIKSLGCNLVRIHIAGIDPRIYKLADRLGLLLWVEVPSPHRSSSISRENHKAELLRMVELIATHPSVIVWSLYNEDWGAQDIASNIETRQYIIDMYNFMKIGYPQFLVVDNDGWHHISYKGRLKSDLLTVHLYSDQLMRWKEMLDDLVNGEQTAVAAFPLVVGDPFFFRSQVPLIISEWGGFGFSAYGGPQDNSDKEELIKSFKEELKKRPIAGDVYTQATNIEDEKNGVIDFKTGALQVRTGLFG